MGANTVNALSFKPLTGPAPPNSSPRSLRKVKSRAALSCRACDCADSGVKGSKITKLTRKQTLPRSARTESMDPRYYRSSSPGGRRLAVPARSSTGTFDNYDSIARSPRESYVSPRSSGVIPISTETYIIPSSHTRSTAIDPYSGRPRRATLTTDRSNPAPFQTSLAVPPSPSSRYARDTYVYPPAPPRREHKKVYAVENGQGARLVDERDVDPRDYSDSERPRERRESYRPPVPSTRAREVDESGYSYTDPAGMYRDTEPRWRTRRGSIDREGGSRPSSIIDPYGPPARASTRDHLGPPPTTRGLEKLNESLARTGSLRDPRSSSQDRSGSFDHYLSPTDPYDVPLRPHSAQPPLAPEIDDRYGYDRAPYEDERDSRGLTPRFKDDQVESRGFGIRSSSVDRRGSSPERVDPRSVPPPPRARPVSGIYGDDTHLPPLDPRDYIPKIHTDDGRRDIERRRERERPADRDRPKEREYDRHHTRDRETVDRDSRFDPDYERERVRRDRNHEDQDRHRHSSNVVPAAAAAAAAVYGASALSDKRERRHDLDDDEAQTRRPSKQEPLDRDIRGGDFEREKSRRAPKLEPNSRDEPDDRDYNREKSRRVTKTDQHDREEINSKDIEWEKSRHAPRAERVDREETNGKDRERESSRRTPRLEITDRDREVPDDREFDRGKTHHRMDSDDSDHHRHSSIAIPAAAAATAAIYGAASASEKRDRDRGLDVEDEAPHNRRPSKQDIAYAAPPAPLVAPMSEKRDRDRGLGTETEDSRDWRPSKMEAGYVATSAPSKADRERGLDKDEEEPRSRRTPRQDPNDREDTKEREYAEKDRAERRRERYDEEEIDPDEDYRRRVQQAQMELASQEAHRDDNPIREDRSEEFDDDRERRHREKQDEQALVLSQSRHNSLFDSGIVQEPDALVRVDSNDRDRENNRVRIVEPPKKEDTPPPVKGILKQPTQKFPEHPNLFREGVAPLKDSTKKGIPPSARWTRIDRRLVNPQALEELGERFEERLDCVIVLRVLTKEEIQKFADRTSEIRAERNEGENKRHSRRKDDREKKKDHDDEPDTDDESREREADRRRAAKDRERDRDRHDRDREAEKVRDREQRDRERETVPRDRERDTPRDRGKDRERDEYRESAR